MNEHLTKYYIKNVIARNPGGVTKQSAKIKRIASSSLRDFLAMT